MKSRIIWAVVVLAALAGFYYTTIRQTQTPSPGISRQRLEKLRDAPLPQIAPPPLPTPDMTMPVIPPPVLNQPIVFPPVVGRRERSRPPALEVPIQEGATIDFSIGAPVVRSGGKDQEALDKALRDMAEATKGTTFPPTKKNQ